MVQQFAKSTSLTYTTWCFRYSKYHQDQVQYNLLLRSKLSGGTRWRGWLRHCATSPKVAGSNPDRVIGIFHWHNPSGCTMALGLTQPLTEMSTRNISWGVKAAGASGWQPTTFMWRLSSNLGASSSWNPQDLSRPVLGLLYLLFDCSH